MSQDQKAIQGLIQQLEGIRAYAEKLEERMREQVEIVHPNFQKSALNLLHYLALRHQDITKLQNQLGHLGVSRIAKAESHVMASIQAVERILHYLAGSNPDASSVKAPPVNFAEGNEFLETNSTALLGEAPENRRVRIMVTLPTIAAEQEGFIQNLMENGMNCARINCAHDDEHVWQVMVDRTREASKKLGKECEICMDLGGPKLRTGQMQKGPKVQHLKPNRDLYGNIMSSYQVWLAPIEVLPPTEGMLHIPLSMEWLSQVEIGDKVRYNDARGKRRSLKVIGTFENGRLAEARNSAYLLTGMPISLERKGEEISSSEIGEMEAVEMPIILHIGDTLVIHKDARPGEGAEFDEDGQLVAPAHVSCTLASVFDDVKAGEPIILDDGKIEGVIREVTPDEMKVEITYAKEAGAKLKGDKGINLPESDLKINGLTEKDKKDLRFVAMQADVVNMSFVNTPEDVFLLLDELDRLGAKEDFGIILKIETQRSFRNLPGILLAAMRKYPIGVMIARGDLAVECGWDLLAEVQEEILRLCEAAHVPNVWATQVLESMAKKGRPSRAEITDAAMSQRAECVMLNKGPYIVDAIRMLDEILVRMQTHQKKKAPILPTLKVPEYFTI